MKILYATTISATMDFFPEHIRMLQNEGHTVELACNLSKALPSSVEQLGSKAHHIPFSRSPFSKDNIAAYQEFKALVTVGKYDIIHTHTPNASVVVRLACRKARKNGTKVFYTAHGFHFYKGAPLKNWLLYYPVELVLSWLTDVLITINKEDYSRAKKSLHAKETVYMPGVGLDFAKFDIPMSEEDRLAKRAELGVPAQGKLLVSVGELNSNKNHQVIIRALAKLNDPNIHYCIAGVGPLCDDLTKLSNELGVGGQVHLLGYRRDVAQIYKAGDVCCFPSIREGLGMAVLESMACGLPVVAADNRGTRDMIINGESGLLCPSDDVDAFANGIQTVLDQPEMAKSMAQEARQNAERFSIENALAALREIYRFPGTEE